MINFNYKARDRAGALASGRLEAESSKEAALQLEKSGLTPISIEDADASNIMLQIGKIFSGFQKVKSEDLVVFTRQLASALEAGVPLINSLDAVAEQIRNGKFRAAVLSVKKDIEGGLTFSDAMEKQHGIFPALIVNMVRAGEKAGILPKVLDRVSNLIEKDMQTTDKVKSASRYPMIVLVALGLAFVVMSVYIVPKFFAFFSAFKAELPLPTRMLMWVNHAIVNYWYWVLGVIVVLVFSFRRAVATEKGRYNFDRLVLSTPVFGPLYLRIYLSRFGSMLSAMLASGIPILEALTITSATVENKMVARIILDIRNEVAKGKTLTEPMKSSKIFPPISVSMVAIGEKAGTLENMLDKMADYFDREVDYTIKNLTPLIEPILILGLGILMLVFALGVFLPMWDMIKVFKSY
ncbi:MAG: type II secretion system F family protein [Candidatus Margulisiibacteriota bacterium]